MMKRAVMALLLSLSAASVFAAGSVKVFTSASEEPKTLTGAEHLLDLVGQSRLSNSWWPWSGYQRRAGNDGSRASAAGITGSSGDAQR